MENDTSTRVNTAVLRQTVFDVEKKLDYIIEKLDKLSESSSRYDERIKQVERNVDKLSFRSFVLDALIAVAAAVAAVLAALS